MPIASPFNCLLASPEPAFLTAVEPILIALGARVQIVLSAEAALCAMAAADSPSLVLLDGRLAGMDMDCLLAATRAEMENRFPIVLFSDSVTEQSKNRLAEGVLDDLLPTTVDPDQLSLRLEMVLRAHRRNREIELLRNAIARNDQTDRLTGAYTREALLALLFRETDRVQRMKTDLCFVLLDIDDFGHWNSRLGAAACDDLLAKVVERLGVLLRSYDLLGRVGKDEFLAALPGCSAVNASLLAERIRMEVFGMPFAAGSTAVRLTACFGITPSHGRSPVVVLREAEEALRLAREAGPDTIRCAADGPSAKTAPVAFLSPGADDDLLAW